MITRDTIVQRLKATPFRPFKLKLSDGRVFDVREHDDLWAALSGTLVFDPGADRGSLAFSHVTHVIDLTENRPNRKTRPVARRAKPKVRR